jgi:hypothetical protein
VFSKVIVQSRLGRKGLDNLWNRILLIRGLLLLVDSILRRVDLLLVGLALVHFRFSFRQEGERDSKLQSGRGEIRVIRAGEW